MIRIITIDGPSGSGKGTITRQVAARLGWHVLDSGALYRVLGVALLRNNLDTTDITVPYIVENLDVAFVDDQVLFEGVDVSADIRLESIGELASRIAAIPTIRTALLARQRACAMPPGLVADGRDMGTLVFPNAQVKIFLTANTEERAKRRYNQLKEKGLSVNISDLTMALRNRDERDRTRSVAPLKAAAAALEVDSTGLTIDEVLRQVMDRVFMTFPDLQV